MASWTDQLRVRSVGRPAASVSPGVGVVVPAHNEEHLVGACLLSVAAAVDEMQASTDHAPVAHIVVVLDACTDGTRAEVEAFPRVHVIAASRRRVGWARRLGAEYALGLLGGGAGWLASTDADSEVPRDWLIRMIALARDGADLVLGTVEPSPGLSSAVLRRYRAGYHQAEGHRHVHAANLGISAAAYRALGGWPPVACHEDAILARRATAAGMTIVRTGSIPVRTSSRLAGRAPAGFAAHLAALTTAAMARP